MSLTIECMWHLELHSSSGQWWQLSLGSLFFLFQPEPFLAERRTAICTRTGAAKGLFSLKDTVLISYVCAVYEAIPWHRGRAGLLSLMCHARHPQTSNAGECATFPLTACVLAGQVLPSTFNTAIIQSLPGGFSRPLILDFFPQGITFIFSCLFPRLLLVVCKCMENKDSDDTEDGKGLWSNRNPGPTETHGNGKLEGRRRLAQRSGQGWTELSFLILHLDCKTYPSSRIAFELYCSQMCRSVSSESK